MATKIKLVLWSEAALCVSMAMIATALLIAPAHAQSSTAGAPLPPGVDLEPAPAPAAPEPASLADREVEAKAIAELLERLQRRRDELESRRQVLEAERRALSDVETPASPEEIAAWQSSYERVAALQSEIESLRLLTNVLTPTALAAVEAPAPSAGAGAFAPGIGLTATTIDANLRTSPAHVSAPLGTLPQGTPIVQLARSDGGWSVVATSIGIGFILSSQLQMEK